MPPVGASRRVRGTIHFKVPLRAPVTLAGHYNHRPLHRAVLINQSAAIGLTVGPTVSMFGLALLPRRITSFAETIIATAEVISPM